MEISQNTPLVSFIITYHNQPADMLAECVDSIRALSLSREEREIIVIDDGSDISPEKCLRKQGGEMVYVRQANAGVSAARNAGLRIARGKFVQFVDADDSLIAASYDFCLGIARQKQADIVAFRLTHRQRNRRKRHTTEGPMTGTAYMQHHNLRGSVCGYLLDRNIIRELTFTPGVRYSEDEEFTAKAVLRARALYTTPAVAYYYRPTPLSATHQRDTASLKRRLEDALGTLLRLNAMVPTLSEAGQKALRRRTAQLSMDHIYNTLVLTRSDKSLEACISQLRQNGLFPLPNEGYTLKYTWFRSLCNSRTGRTLLRLLVLATSHNKRVN